MRPALRDVNLKIRRGDFLVVMGPSGCGKSTLCLTLNGVIPHFIKGAFAGDALVAGMNTREHAVSEIARKVGMVLQNPEAQLFCMSVESEVAFGPENLGFSKEEVRHLVEWALKVTRLNGLEKRPPASLSLGQKQQLAIASALAMRPEVLVLDEATSNLDPLGAIEVFSTVQNLNKRYNMTIVMVEHRSELIAEYANKVVVMNCARIVFEGSPTEVFRNKDLLKKAGIRPPQVSEVSHILRENGILIDETPVTMSEAYRVFSKLLGR